MRKWIPAVPIALALVASASVYPRLPADVQPDWSRIVPITVASETMPRLPFVLLLPAVAMAVAAAMAWGARVTGARDGAFLNEETGAKAIARFEPTFTMVITGVVGLLVLMHLALLSAAAGWPAWAMQAIGIALGLGLAIVGNVVPRIRPNWIVGVRTQATLRDPALWMRTHRYLGMFLMVGGVVVVILSLVAPRYVFAVAIGALVLASLLAYLLARTRATGAAVVVLTALLMALVASGCRTAANTAVVSHTPQDAFWAGLQSLCGKAYAGRLTEGNASDSTFRTASLVMHVRQCGPSEIRIPFHVNEDRSRTWVLTRTAGGLRLKHDHRHADGSEDRVTQYGGDTRDSASATRQDFHADAHTASLIPAARTNIWTVEIVPGRLFAYGLRREGTDRRFRVEFDVTKPIAAPPPPWGASR